MVTFDKSNLKSIIQNLNKGRVLVIGDFAIDEMIYGQTHRISREAPVLILKHTHTNIILGTASNAANNIAALSSNRVATIGLYGEDYYGPILLETLNKARIDTSYMVLDPSRVTSTKTRISGSSTQSVTQQIVRIDREICDPVNSDIEAKIIDNINKCAHEFDAILLSDYGIGLMTQNIIDTAIQAAKKHNLFIAVDAQTDLTRFQGVTVITPNQPEAENTLGYELKDHETLIKGGRELLEKTSSEMILITRGSEGMMLFEKNGNISSIPAFNKTEVFDVTGAGDTVVGTFTLGLCAGAAGAECMFLGNLAASIVVRQFGSAITTIPELTEKIDNLNTEDLGLKI
ncbi:MAG: RfaE bifunctional protein [uncultured bacterium]|nr:MAG: RfaE bifunctional protein [uncultured bacterium]